jgi:tol-pal system protein YbgF
MERELQALRSQNERLQNEVEQMQARQRDLFLAVDQRIEGQGSSDGVEQPPQSQQTQTESAENNSSEDSNTPVDTSESTEIKPVAAATRPVFDTDNTEDSAATTQAYREAFLLLKQRDYEAAITAFEGFLQTYPTSKYSANAQYWMAEANYVTKRYAEALQQFQTVIDQYPTSSKVPDARLKIGYTYYELGQWEEARVTLTRLRAQFPNSTVAGLAQQRLERLEEEGH